VVLKEAARDCIAAVLPVALNNKVAFQEKCVQTLPARIKGGGLHIIEVPRALPLKATLPSAFVDAGAELSKALTLVDEAGCEATAEIVRTRDAGSAIVDESNDQSYALLLLGLVRTPRNGRSANPTLNATLLYVLSHATCKCGLYRTYVSIPLVFRRKKGVCR
jgi:hypothetical protein